MGISAPRHPWGNAGDVASVMFYRGCSAYSLRLLQVAAASFRLLFPAASVTLVRFLYIKIGLDKVVYDAQVLRQTRFLGTAYST